MSELHGVISAMLTPFVSDVGPVDYEWLPAYLRYLESNGINGVVVMGTTGEGPSLAIGERERMLDTVIKFRGNLKIIAGTGCAALTETIALSRYAIDAGADAVLVMPPFYIKSPAEAGVLHYYRALCDALPEDSRVLLYHIPAVTGVPITPTIIEGLLQSHGRQFYGMKDSAGNAEHTSGLIANYPQLQIFSGSDHQIANALAAGATGVISALSSAFPALVHSVYAAYQAGGDVAAAQTRLSTVRRLIDPLNTPPALKSALPWLSDLPETAVRLPLVPLDNEAATLLRQQYEELKAGAR